MVGIFAEAPRGLFSVESLNGKRCCSQIEIVEIEPGEDLVEGRWYVLEEVLVLKCLIGCVERNGKCVCGRGWWAKGTFFLYGVLEK